MVYCGKPSKGCQNCRARKIRCDQVEPACTQCTKVKKECPGYRNMLDLAFRDQSEFVIEKCKAKARTSPPRTKKTPRVVAQRQTNWSNDVDLSCIPQISGGSATSSASSAALSDRPNFSSLSPDSLSGPNRGQDRLVPLDSISTYSMFPTIQERGVNFFFANFVLSPNGPSHGYFGYVPELCSNGGMDDLLKASISGAGLAWQANICKSSQMMAQARREYAVALQKVNKALRSPSEVVKDSTLLSIMVLAIFETISGGRNLSLREWTEHINGAAALVKLRGPAQLCSPVGFGLFIHTTSHLLISCLQREIPMPKQIIDLRMQAMNDVTLDPGWHFLELTDQITVFRNDVKTGIAGSHREIISKALELDTKLACIFLNAPVEWMYETVYTEEESEVIYDCHYHIYHDHWISQLWNGMRATRIMLNEIIRGQVLEGFTAVPPVFTITDFSTQFHNSTNNINQMRDDILRSVPQHLGYINRKPFQPTEPSSVLPDPIYPEFDDFTPFNNPLSDENQLPLEGFDDPSISAASNNPFSSPPLFISQPPLHRNPSHQCIGGYFLIWPLYVSGITRTCTPAVRDFASRILRYIGEEMGIRQGTNLVNFMEASPLIGDEGLRDMTRLMGQRPIGPLKEMLLRDEKERVRRMGRTVEAVS